MADPTFTARDGTHYYLHRRTGKHPKGKGRVTTHHLSKNPDGALTETPEGFEVVFSPLNGMPVLHRKRPTK